MKIKNNKFKLPILCLFIIGLFVLQYEYTNMIRATQEFDDIEEQSAKINFDDYDSIMIVAHPDDETIWGGNHLIKGNYIVVCITGADNKIRNKEFFEVMKQSNSQGIMLNYPDKTDGKRDNWNRSKHLIYKDIEYIINKKKWKQIVTHNPDGEYGHMHHKMSSQMVSKVVKQANLDDELMYFGKYIKKQQLSEYEGKAELKNTISDGELQQKEQLTTIYKSQKKVMNHLKHMFSYENWISYQDWNQH